MDQNNNHIPTYLIYGDSGSGKSTFIQYLNGLDKDNKSPETGGLGVAVTIEPGTIYLVNDEVLGKLQLIDTRGTWDPSQLNNDVILQNLVKTLLDYSIQEMNNNLNPIQQLDGILYVHNSFIDRYARSSRITQLGLLIGSDLTSSTITIMTRCREIQYTTLNANFLKWSEQLHKNDTEYIYWDSVNPLQNQKEKLKDLLKNLQPIQLTNIKEANQRIIEQAKQMQLNDLIQVDEPRVRTKIIKYQKEKRKTKSQITNITLTCNPPKGLLPQIGGWIPVKIPYISGGNNITTTSIRIDAEFPNYALPPKLIISCDFDKKLEEIKGQNLEIVQHEFINYGDYCDANFRYKWAGTNTDYAGRIDLKIKMVIEFRQIKDKQREEKEEYLEKVMKPRYSDEKPYLNQIVGTQFDILYSAIKNNIQ